MKLDGQWQLTEGRTEGGPLPADLVQTMRLEIDGTSWMMRTPVNVDAGRLVFFPGTQPARMEIHGVSGPNAGRTFTCIYRAEGNTLEILYDLSGTLFAPSFEVPLTGPLFYAKFARM